MKKIAMLAALALVPMAAWSAGNHSGGHGGQARDAAASEAAHGQEAGHGAAAAHDHGAGAGHAAVDIGHPGDMAQASRTVEVSMDDMMRFSPARIDVAAGETVRFVVHNNGDIAHEMVLGSLEDLRAHAVQMREQPGMAHAEQNAVSLEGKASGELVWTFGQAGTVDFACLLPGHSEAGMVGQISVI